MVEEEILKIIKDKTINFLDSNAFPGYHMTLSEDALTIENKTVHISIRIWYELNVDGKQPSKAYYFIITTDETFIIIDNFNEAIEVWTYYLKKYPYITETAKLKRK